MINNDHSIENVLVARVNCEEEDILCDYLNINAYPALNFFPVDRLILGRVHGSSRTI